MPTAALDRSFSHADAPVLLARRGPIGAADFERWEQDDANPCELLAGWVLPMSPGTRDVGRLLARLAQVLGPVTSERGFDLLIDARHRLPAPQETVVFPDLALHTAEATLLAGTETVARVPELVIEILGEETAARDRGPNGAKFLAYEASGVEEYYYAWADGREASAYRREAGRLRALPPDADGFFASAVLGLRFRVVPPAVGRLG